MATEPECRVPLLEDPPELSEESVDVFVEAVDVNGCRSVMKFIAKHDAGFIEWSLGRLLKARKRSTDYTHAIVGEGHLLGGIADEVADRKSRANGLMEKLEADCITCRDVSVFSVALQAAVAFNEACLRWKDFSKLAGNTTHDEDRALMRLRRDRSSRQRPQTSSEWLARNTR